MNCNYCGKPCEWVENKEIYGRNYGKSYMAWLCRDCDAYVGCHNNTKKSLGTLANKQLRELRKKAKNLFISAELSSWDCKKSVKDKAYKKLNDLFKKEFHFGSSTEKECLEIIKFYN